MRKNWLCYLLVAGMLGSNMPITVQAGSSVKCTNVSGSKVTIAKGSNFTLKTNVSTDDLTFTSSNEEVAKVDAKGVISTLKKGRAVVTVSSKNSGASKMIAVTVASPKGYAISKASGTYNDSVNVKIKAKKGYKVYYSNNGKLSVKKVVKQNKTKTIKITKTTDLTLYVFKNNAKITKSAQEKNKSVYTYVINKGNSITVQDVTTAQNATSQQAATTGQSQANAGSQATQQNPADAGSQATQQNPADASSQATAQNPADGTTSVFSDNNSDVQVPVVTTAQSAAENTTNALPDVNDNVQVPVATTQDWYSDNNQTGDPNAGATTAVQGPSYATSEQPVVTTENNMDEIDPGYTITTTQQPGESDNRPQKPDTTQDFGNATTSQTPDDTTQNPAFSTTEDSYGVPDSSTQVPGMDTSTQAPAVSTEDMGDLVQAEMPNVYFMANGDNEGILYDVTTDSVYSVDGGVTWNPITSEGAMQISGVTVQYGVLVKRLGDGVTTADSAICGIMVSQAASPRFKATQPTAEDALGYIPLTPNHEYRLLGDTAWMSATGTTAVVPGTYEVRVRANGNTLASKTQTIVINAYNGEVTTQGNSDIAQPDEDGSTQVPDVDVTTQVYDSEATTEADGDVSTTESYPAEATTEVYGDVSTTERYPAEATTEARVDASTTEQDEATTAGVPEYPTVEPTTETPVTEPTTASVPEYPTVEPTTEAPVTEPTTADVPEYPTVEPTTETPVTEPTTADVPEYPTTVAPTTEAPTTEAPVTEPTTAGVPEYPTTEVPTTEAPTTEAPTTEVPTTEAPTTEAPSTEDSNEGETTEDTSTSYAILSDQGAEVVLVANPTAKKEYTNASGEEVLSITKKNKVTITKGGTYRFTQTANEQLTGRIEVEAEDQDVTIILAGVNLTSDDTDGVLTVKKKAGDVNVILADGTQNTFADTAAIETEEVTDETTGETTTETTYPDGAVVCKQNALTISGAGSLTVSSTLGSGVKSTGSLTICDSAKVTVTAAGNNGISGKTALNVDGAELNITSTGDGIKTTTPDDETDTTLGNIVLKDSKITIASNEDGVQAYRDATITNCTMDVTATQDSNKLTTVEGETRDSFKGIKAAVLTFNGGNYKVVCNIDKCIKADTELNINGGTFDVTSGSESNNSAYAGPGGNMGGMMPGESTNNATGDDGLHSDGSVTIDGADTDITIWAADDGIHANDALTIKNGKINITRSYEGLEAANMYISGGEIHLVSSDDGINVAGGADGSGTTGGDVFGPGWGSTGSTSTGSYSLEITGGTIYMNADGDGLDSNGTITMSGGEVYVSGPTNSGNGAIDYEQSFSISGGILVAVGAQGMDETPSTTSTQCSVRFALSSTQAAGTKVTLKDASGNEVVSYTAEKQFNSVVISAPELTNGSSYSLYLNDSLNTTTTLTGIVTGGGNSMQPGGNQGWWQS